ncbi:hypothetical protein U1763_17540 [Sphingomonas sp. LB2R24]|uniref:hypothetical protein n=1 Tax=Sphingomonas sorbitolis TaxID=3096165 RepID=UPI002FCB1D7C
MVFIGNLYQLGPKTAPRTAGMPLIPTGAKRAILAKVVRDWQDATPRVRTATLRGSDFYGPGVAGAHLGASASGELA